MKKLTVILLFTTIFGYAQIDYKGLVKNLEDVTIDTDVKEYLKGLPFHEGYSEIEFNDERFLRFYGIIVNKVKFKNGWNGKTMDITPFNEKEDFEKIKAKLIELYGEPEKNDNGVYGGPEINKIASLTNFRWETEKLNIVLKIKLEEEDSEGVNASEFKSFDDFYITFKSQQ